MLGHAFLYSLFLLFGSLLIFARINVFCNGGRGFFLLKVNDFITRLLKDGHVVLILKQVEFPINELGDSTRGSFDFRS